MRHRREKYTSDPIFYNGTSQKSTSLTQSRIINLVNYFIKKITSLNITIGGNPTILL